MHNASPLVSLSTRVETEYSSLKTSICTSLHTLLCRIGLHMPVWNRVNCIICILLSLSLCVTTVPPNWDWTYLIKSQRAGNISPVVAAGGEGNSVSERGEELTQWASQSVWMTKRGVGGRFQYKINIENSVNECVPIHIPDHYSSQRISCRRC